MVQVFLVQVSYTQLKTALFRHRNCPARDTNHATWFGRPVVIVFVVICFWSFFVTHLFSFHTDLKMECNSDEIGVSIDFIHDGCVW